MFEKVSKLALASMVVGFLFFIPMFSGIAAIILGTIALYVIAEYKPSLRGRGFAITGIILGIGQLVCIAVISASVAGAFFFAYTKSGLRDLAAASRYKESGEIKKAIQCYKKALCRIPGRTETLCRIPGRTETGYFKEAFRKTPHPKFGLLSDRFLIYHNMGVTLQLNGDNEEALQAYSNALEVAHKEEAAVHYGMGYVYMNQKQFDGALQEYDNSIELNPDMYDAYQNKAVAFRLMGRFQDSVDACQETIRLFPEAAKTYCSLGWAYEKLQSFEDAIEAHVEAIRLSPKWQFPKKRISYCFSQLQNKEIAFDLLQELEQADFSLAQEIREKYEIRLR
ncbi:MAG: tetratricopeptide repeat protein [Candidatus Omnitrophica bacterium]|nr:tetratricopeptide repeat protein [Candidatus Omnitrophota bacterium]